MTTLRSRKPQPLYNPTSDAPLPWKNWCYEGGNAGVHLYYFRIRFPGKLTPPYPSDGLCELCHKHLTLFSPVERHPFLWEPAEVIYLRTHTDQFLVIGYCCGSRFTVPMSVSYEPWMPEYCTQYVKLKTE